MRILVLAVGRDRGGPIADLVADYVKRCPWRVDVINVQPKRQGTAVQRLTGEADKLRPLIPNHASRIMLDERGVDLESRALAKHIEHVRQEGRNTICFVIGGADGLAPSLLDEADFRLAFGRATWPHRLIKVMLAEQIYRVSTILSGHPYHRD